MYTIKALHPISSSLLTELTARYIIHLEREGIRMDKLSVKKPEAYPWSDNGFVSNEYFEIIDCGNLIVDFDTHLCRPNGRRDYQLIYILKGKYHVIINGKSFIAEKGNVILFKPDEVQDYSYYKKDLTHAYWVHFSGHECERIFSECNLSDVHIISLSHTSEIEYLLGKLCYYYHLEGNQCASICNGLLISVLGLVGHYSQSSEIRYSRINSKNQALISSVVSRIKQNEIFEMNVAKCAEFCNMSPAHFTRKFKELVGVSPQDFITKSKLERAQQLLFYTDKSISEIAIEVGYNDPNYFSRIFKKTFQMTPKEYREQITE